MSEERIKTEEELASDESPLSAEDLEKVSGGAAEQIKKLTNHEEDSK